MFNFFSILVGLPCVYFLLMSTNQYVFLILLFAMTEMALFVTTAPVNAAILSIVPDNLRTYSMSYCHSVYSRLR